MKNNLLLILLSAICFYIISIAGSGCAQIGAPTGGPRDTVAPLLVRASPGLDKLNFTGNKITLSFNEYIEIQDLQNNLLVSPLQKINPVINSNLKTVTIRLRDTLKPNTTYSINFGNAIKDVNEGNIFKDFSYTFSTGSTIDSMELHGQVLMAETGKADSSLLVLLYRNVPDSAVQTKRPDYITRLKGDGSFRFTHLPADNFKIYALKDGDGSKTYNSKTETFAFYDSDVMTPDTSLSVNLYAYAEEKEAKKTGPSSGSNKPSKGGKEKDKEKKLKYTTNITPKGADLLSPLELSFNGPLKNYDAQKLVLSDSNYKPIKNVQVTVDSTRRKITLKTTWQPEAAYVLVIPQDALEDSAGITMAKADTTRFMAKKLEDYGSLLLRFKNIDLAKHPLVQFLQGDVVVYSSPVLGKEWSDKMFNPGEYDLRILYDVNNNGKWDPGNYKEKHQPEIAITLKDKIAIKADWENEREVEL